MTPEEQAIFHEQRRREVSVLKSRISRLEKSNRDLQETVGAFTESLAPLLGDLEQLVGLLKAATGAFKVLEFIGKLAKPVAAIASFLGGLWLAWQKFKG